MHRHVQRAFIWADRAHLIGDDAARQLVVELKRLDRAATLELMQAVPDAVHRAAEGVAQLPGVSVVVAVGEHEMLRPALLLKPAQPRRRDHRIDQHPLGSEVVRADVTVDPLPQPLPVPKAGSDLLHEPSVARPNAEVPAAPATAEALRPCWTRVGAAADL